MFMSDVSFISLTIAFGAGILSFLSPCVLPLVPAHLSFIGGFAGEDIATLYGKDPKLFRFRIVKRSLAFVLGFSLVFIALGVVVVGFSASIGVFKTWLEKIAGILVILLGLHLLGIYRIAFLARDVRYHGDIKGGGVALAFLTGMAFGFGWTPCVGPILAGILSMAALQDTFWQGFILLIFYSFGLAVPFFLAGVFVPQFLSISKNLRTKILLFEKVAGVLLLCIGVVFMLNKMSFVSYYLSTLGLPSI